jgi:hypothetical protein
MNLVLAQIANSTLPTFFAVFAGAIGVMGCLAAVVAYASTSRERSAIKKADMTLASSESWEGANAVSEHSLSEWLRNRAIDPESGVADVIRVCWSAWLGSRSTALTELHVLVARRERTKAPARLSAGIAALLLVIGIVGTLSSVKPILKAFQFGSSTPDGAMPVDDGPSIVNIADSTALVNSLMHSLGDSFLPSLVALAFTVLVVALRGIYSLGLQRYTLELDRFAIGTVMPHFRPRSISDEYAEVRAIFGSLAKTMGDREEKFDNVITQLTKFVDSVGPSLKGMDSGIDKMTTAADALASKSNSIATTLTRTLGKKSPLYAAVDGFEGIFAATNDRLAQLSQHIDGIRSEQQDYRNAMQRSLNEISEVTKQVSDDHQREKDNVSKNIEDLRTVVAKIPADLLESAQKTFDDGMTAIRITLMETVDKLAKDVAAVHQDTRSKAQETVEKVAKDVAVVHQETRSKTKEALDFVSQSITATTTRINESVKSIPIVVDKLNESLKRQSETEKAAAEAIKSLAQDAKDAIRDSHKSFVVKPLEPSTPAPSILPTIDPKPGHLQVSNLNPSPDEDPPLVHVQKPSDALGGNQGLSFFSKLFKRREP